MAQFDRHFSYEEAQDQIPWVKSVFRRIHAVLHSLEFPQGLGPALEENYGVERGADRQTFQLLQKIPQMASPEVLIGTLGTEERQHLLQGLVHGLKNEGIIVQDIRRGLIDFPSWRDSREILLCYELADGDRIGHWHEVDAGFAGRREIQAEDDL